MKRILLSILMVAACLCGAMAQNDAMFVYRNDGQINAFLKADVDSMRYSHIGLDSLYHGEYVVQEVWTPDSIYRILLAAIDSVSFVTPPTVLQTEVIALEGDLRATLVGVEGGKLLFSQESEKYHHFKVGEKLVTLEMSDVFPVGFKGEVAEVGTEDGNISVVFIDVDMEEIFQSYCCIINSVSKDPDKDSETRNSEAKYIKDFTKTFEVPTLSTTWDLMSEKLPFSNGFEGGASISSSLKPTFVIKGCNMVDPERGHIVDINIFGKYDVERSFDINIGVSKRKELPFFPLGKEWEIGVAPLLSFFFDAGLFIEGSANISFSQSSNSTYVSTFNIQRTKNSVEPTLPIFKEVSRSDTDYKLAFKGRVACGLYIEAGIKPWLIDKNALSKVSLRVDAGIELESQQGFDIEDLRQASLNTALYDAVNIKDGLMIPNFYFGCYAALKFNIRWTPIEFNWTIGRFTLGDVIFQGGFFPHFSDIKYRRNGNPNEINCKCSTSRLCPFDYEVGFSVFDSDGNKLKTEYYPTLYSKNPFKRFDEYDIDIRGIEKNKKYVVYPCLKVFGYEVLASPSIEVYDQKRVAEITDFNVTGSEYSPGDFLNDGIAYDYKFDVAITAKIDNLEGVADWGYVYKDPYGNIKRISLMQYGTSYTDTRYSYYRNEPKSTACLYAYVRYDGDPEYYDEEPYGYPLEFTVHSCPDGNHPHAIDLGLPSGTKWCCRNVGASSPEDYGGYYAWGETSEKSEYTKDNYAYYDKATNKYINIGAEISGTQYDVAHAVMGGSWRMPTREQINELLVYCTREWSQLNGVDGLLVTGPNGGQIFLPAAGCRWNDYLGNAGSRGYYWSGSLNPDYDDYACVLYFGSGNRYWCWDDRYYGRSGRAVCP